MQTQERDCFVPRNDVEGVDCFVPRNDVEGVDCFVPRNDNVSVIASEAWQSSFMLASLISGSMR
jgi:hypothetical protein